jgi:glucose/arabinose dehydrogenase
LVKDAANQALGEIYAYGFRNPFRINWTSGGSMLALNIGQAHIESVNLIMPGHDYGWPIREGTFRLDPFGDITKVYPLPADDDTYQVTYPVAQYDHDEGLAIAGGFEYTGSSIKELIGKYLFADMNNGRLYYIDLADVTPGKQSQIREWTVSFKGQSTSFAELCGNERVDLRIGKDSSGEIYFFSKQDGKVYRVGRVKNI